MCVGVVTGNLRLLISEACLVLSFVRCDVKLLKADAQHPSLERLMLCLCGACCLRVALRLL